jgi:hypothetical protein
VYLSFLQSSLGGAAVVCAAIAVVLVLVLWARARGHGERLLILGTAALLTLVVAAVYVLALTAGWWTGGYFTISPIVQACILVAAALLFWTVWLAGYQWLGDHTRQPIQIYVVVSLLLVLAVAIAHRLNLGRGQILVGPDLTVVIDAVVAQILLWIPVLVYEALRRNLERMDPIP